MPDRRVLDAAWAIDVERRQPGRAHLRERLRVAAVVAADHDHHVEVARVEHGEHRVLPILRGGTDRVERAEAMFELRIAVAVPHRACAASPGSPDSRVISIVVWFARPIR